MKLNVFKLILTLLLNFTSLALYEGSVIARGLSKPMIRSLVQPRSSLLSTRNIQTARNKSVPRAELSKNQSIRLHSSEINNKPNLANEIFLTLTGFALFVFAGIGIMFLEPVIDMRQRYEYLRDLETHERSAIGALRTCFMYHPEDYNKILLKAIKRNDDFVINIIRKYQWEKINFNDMIWNDKELLEACYKNGYADLADFLKTIHDYNGSFIPNLLNSNTDNTILSFDLSKTETEASKSNLIYLERREKYTLFCKTDDYRFNYKSPSSSNENFFDADDLIRHGIMNNDLEFIYLVRKYHDFEVDLESLKWKTQDFLSKCHQNGFEYLMDEIKAENEHKRLLKRKYY